MSTMLNENFSDEEVLQSVDRLREHSPIIDFLCKRLERAINKEFPSKNPNVECPICEAELEVHEDEGSETYRLDTRQVCIVKN